MLRALSEASRITICATRGSAIGGKNIVIFFVVRLLLLLREKEGCLCQSARGLPAAYLGYTRSPSPSSLTQLPPDNSRERRIYRGNSPVGITDTADRATTMSHAQARHSLLPRNVRQFGVDDSVPRVIPSGLSAAGVS